jgi:hypothetical protein
MNELALDKLKGLLHVACISLIIVGSTATMLRIGLAPQARADSNGDSIISEVNVSYRQ